VRLSLVLCWHLEDFGLIRNARSVFNLAIPWEMLGRCLGKWGLNFFGEKGGSTLLEE